MHHPRRLHVTTLIVGFALCACSKPSPDAAPPIATAVAPAAPAAPAAMNNGGGGSGGGSGAGKMVQCPNAVRGAKTAISDSSSAIAITVTANDDDAVKEIRDRAEQIALAAAKTQSGEVKHDGSGNGGGGFGGCPIVLKDTSISEKDMPGGALFTVTPKNAKDLPALKQEVRDRSAKFDWK
ncbi:MAG: hypothetical protein ACLQVI_24270 [Polyangiaceae bacterium]